MKKYKLDKFDYIIIFALTIICGIMSFYKLGDIKVPSSFWKSATIGEYVTIELDKDSTISKVAHYGNIPNSGGYKVSYSNDGENFIDSFVLGDKNGISLLTNIGKSDFFKWKYDIISTFNAKYIKVESVYPGWGINELAFINTNNEIVKFKVIDSYYGDKSIGKPEMLFDEQELVLLNSTYMSETYFDEIYFPRTAYEQLNGWSIYENTHPPFGKILISIGISVFGMNPFGWRFMGTLFGVLLIPLMYLFAKKIFKNRKYAFVATFLLMFDFMRFSHTRLATIDSFSAFFVLLMYYFMFDYFSNKEGNVEFDFENKEKKKEFFKTIKPLLFCGIAFGFGVATKWSCLYAAFGLALTFFFKKFSEFWKVRKLKKVSKRWVINNFIPTCLFCTIFFIVIPIIIYTLSYIPYMSSNPDKSLIEIVIENQKSMYNYHSNLDATHPFESRWWTWPLVIKPLWMYVNYNLPEGMYSTIASFGNIAVWLPSLIGVIVALYYILKYKEKNGLILFIAYAFQYFPWIFASRCTFIYAYFIPLPFSILLLVYCMERLDKGRSLAKILLITYLIIVLLLFIVFFPVISGMPANSEYINSLKWFSSWIF